MRGARRDLRHGTLVPWRAVEEVLRPEDLAGARAPSPSSSLPAFAALDSIAPRLDARGLAWGPAGAVGFELATGWTAVHPGSDLDLVVHLTRPPGAVELRSLRDVVGGSRVRVDCLLELPDGAVHLDDVRPGRPVLLRTPTGPELRDAWL